MRPIGICMGICCMLLGCSTIEENRQVDIVRDTDIQLVKLIDTDPTLVIEARYATTHNFTGVKVYPSGELYLTKDAAVRLKRVNQKLRLQGLGLKIWDGYRPWSVQVKFWEIMPDDRYVADPKSGSRHNRGCAVDLTLVDLDGNELPMPTGYDDFSEKAHHGYMDLPQVLIENRKTLKEAMMSEGFEPIDTEWWHYDAPGWEKFPVMDIVPWES